jgi:isoquinoline 1-oxidoreductase beta subunit
MTKMRARDGISRRRLLIGGGIGVGLLVGWAAWPRSYRHNLTAAPDETIFDAFLKIGADGRVAVVVPQAEMGQGVYTSLPQILADELGADWRTVSVEPAPINPLYANSFLMEESARETLPSFLAGIGTWAMREVAIRADDHRRIDLRSRLRAALPRGGGLGARAAVHGGGQALGCRLAGLRHGGRVRRPWR